MNITLKIVARVTVLALASLFVAAASAGHNSQMPNSKTPYMKTPHSEAPQLKTWAEKLGYESGRKVIILHADDVGMSDEANISTLNYLLLGDIQSAAAMAPTPGFDGFILWAKKHPELDVGLHLTLTAEWRTYRWGPVADPKTVPGLLDPDGKLWRRVEQVARHASADEVEIEIRAQIEKSLALGFRPKHIDTHMGTLYARPDYLAAFLKVAEEYHIPANVIDLGDADVVAKHRKRGIPIDDALKAVIDAYKLPRLDDFESIGKGATYDEKRQNFLALVDKLKPGLSEIIFHPAEPTEILKSITGSWQQRGWEAEIFSDPIVKAYFEAEGIIFTNWIEIMARFEALEK